MNTDLNTSENTLYGCKMSADLIELFSVAKTIAMGKNATSLGIEHIFWAIICNNDIAGILGTHGISVAEFSQWYPTQEETDDIQNNIPSTGITNELRTALGQAKEASMERTPQTSIDHFDLFMALLCTEPVVAVLRRLTPPIEIKDIIVTTDRIRTEKDKPAAAPTPPMNKEVLEAMLSVLRLDCRGLSKEDTKQIRVIQLRCLEFLTRKVTDEDRVKILVAWKYLLEKQLDDKILLIASIAMLRALSTGGTEKDIEIQLKTFIQNLEPNSWGWINVGYMIQLLIKEAQVTLTLQVDFQKLWTRRDDEVPF